MSKYELFPDSPLTDQEFAQLDQTVIDSARRQLVGRRFIELYGPLGKGMQSIFNDIFMENYEAKMDFQGSFDLNIESSKRVNYTIPLLYKDFVLYWRDLEQAKVLDIPIDFSVAANAARDVALLEDQMIFHGSKEFEIPGLMNVKGRLTQLLGNWYESGNAFQDVVDARNKLLEMKHNGPFALVLSPELYSLLHRVHKDTNVLEIEHVRELVTDGVFQSPVLKGKTGVLVNTGKNNLDLAVSEDFDTVHLGEEGMNHPFRVYETVVLRIKRPSAICTLEDPET
ncbi:family 1 encapsulin nanocompartment shell protein [Peribacillus asahii]|uniref:Type 1 encapsulin shell protein n=1 Tax=Peribacillus asahii TaxID=228899 RepID=A0A3T0KU71_9BACI|nr:family 1 encapsulin nanocompartment shell protein [Peribacillus asahii]AZV43840.1 bacteriocin [Peribacillus asahii]USK68764.1 bacteriocin family protein [Peribacillus asahii]USK83575.1 bacteriocin family protein [Peribacillus asahii]